MIIAIDIGNTTTAFGIVDGRRLALRRSVPTQPTRTARELARQLKAERLPIGRSADVVLCSVVPKMSSRLVEALRLLGARSIRLIGRDLTVPLRNRYRYPRQVGQDRLVGAYAAWRAYSATCIVVDAGTAITIDVVTRKGEYLGGIITPGLEISRDALAARTALLPHVELRKPPELLGRDTANSIRSGLLYGFGAMCDGLVIQLRHRYAREAVVVATGGSSRQLAGCMRTINHLKPDLVLEGILQLSASR